MPKIFLDTEFTGLTQHTTLISIALVSETGEEFYGECTDYNREMISPWHQEHVLAKLWHADKFAENGNPTGKFVIGTRPEVAAELRKWIEQMPGVVEIWADVLAWDWVLFCELFGGAFSIPENIFYAPFDLATLFRMKGLIEPNSKYEQDLKRFEFVGLANECQHSALMDARVELACYQTLNT